MPTAEIRDYCGGVYSQIYSEERERLRQAALSRSRNGVLSASKEEDIEKAAQKEAIKAAAIAGIRRFPELELASIWQAVYETHMHRKSGIFNAEIIARVVSADQSWKKSSGHAFEELIKLLASTALRDSGIEIILQRDLSARIKAGKLCNEPRDISWLKEQIKAGIFDLYAIVHTEDGRQFCYGCIQSKTSIRDRVTRDREPSMKAMQSFFWSIVIVLDGDFLRLPKFVSMVNGGSPEYEENGWHGMYVFSEQYTQDRIYPTDFECKNFKEHAVTAARFWLSQRQWFNSQWRADPQQTETE